MPPLCLQRLRIRQIYKFSVNSDISDMKIATPNRSHIPQLKDSPKYVFVKVAVCWQQNVTMYANNCLVNLFASQPKNSSVASMMFHEIKTYIRGDSKFFLWVNCISYSRLTSYSADSAKTIHHIPIHPGIQYRMSCHLPLKFHVFI